MNLQIFNLIQNIKDILANSNLPIGVVYYILKDIYKEIEQLYQQQILIEQKENSSLDESDS